MMSVMKKAVVISTFIVITLSLQACITKLVTVPVKVAYGTTKAVVKGTASVVGAVIPDGEDEQKNKDDKNQDKQ